MPDADDDADDLSARTFVPGDAADHGDGNARWLAEFRAELAAEDARDGRGERPPDGDRGERPPDGDRGERPPDGDRGERPPDGDRGERPPDGDRGPGGATVAADHANTRTLQVGGDFGDDGGDGDPGGGAGRAGAQGPPLPVRVVGDGPDADYHPGEVIGEGGSGIVREAVQVALGRTVALKTLRPKRAGEVRGRFLAEARVVGQLDHPNILPVHELATDQHGEPLLAMKRVVGVPWSETLPQVSREKNLRILAAVADAVAFAHSRGVIHRDVKPENVLLGAFGEVLLNDWGLALTEQDRAAARAHQRRAAEAAAAAGRDGDGAGTGDVQIPGRLGGGVDTSGIAGTPAYMAPEQARGDAEDLGPATDVYLLGAVLFEIATGRRPHAGDSLTACLRAAAHNRIDLPPGLTGADPGADPGAGGGADGETDSGADPCEDLLYAEPDEEDCGDLDRPGPDRRRDAADAELIRIARSAMADDPADRPPGVGAFKELLEEYGTHVESAKLTRRGRRLAAEADRSGDYAAFGLAGRTLQEAADVWDGNLCAKQALRAVRRRFVEVACDRGDLELAESLVKSSDLEDDPVADRCRLERQKLADAEAEKEVLEQGVKKWSRAFLASPDCVFLVDLSDGRLAEVNDQFTDLLGYAPAEVVGRTIDSLSFWPPSACRERFVKGLKEKGEFDNAEVNFHRQDGSPVPVLVSARVTEVDGERMVVTNARDVTVKKAQERGLKKSEDRLRRTQRLAGLGTWELDVSRGAVYWSEETFRIAGLDPSGEAPGFDEYLETVHPDDRPDLLAALDAAGKGGDGFELRVRHRRPDGSWNRVLTRGEPIRGAGGEVIELFGSVLDLGDGTS